MRSALLISLLGLACGHSEPFVTADQDIPGPFSEAVPVRLTYSPLSDYEPGVSTDGAFLTYQYERGTADRDRCLAMMPVQGGQRRHEFCAWALDEGGRADGLANAALRTDGMLAFTMHSGIIGNMSSNTAGLYFGPADSLAGVVRVLPLLQQVPGALGVWRDLIDPVWVSEDELLVLAGDRFLRNMTLVCSPIDCFGEFVPRDLARTALRDTIQLGSELVRLRIANNAATVVSTRAVPEAVAWSLDRSNGVAHLVSQSIRAFDDFAHETIADTVYAVPQGGGAATALYGTGGGHLLERIHGIASGSGRIFLSRSWHHDSLAGDALIPAAARPFSEISELLPDGSLRAVTPAVSWHWGRIRLSPDGRTLFAEAVEPTSSDIYRIEIGS